MAGFKLYIPDGACLTAFLEDRQTDVLGIMGPWGSGKSSVCVQRILAMARQQRPSISDGVRRSRWAIIRETVVEMRSTTMKTWFDWVPQSAGRWVDQGPPSHTVRMKDAQGIIELEVLFLGLDNAADVARLDSLELTGAWINEARHVLWENASNVIGRTDRYPSMSEGGSAFGPCLMMDTNPPDPDHWWFQKFEEQRPDGWRLLKQPSGLSAQAENRKWLSPTYYQKLGQGQDEDWIQVYVHGRYGYSKDGKPVYKGKYIDDWHCPGELLLPDRGLPLIGGLDAGGTPAFVLGQKRPNGQSRWLDEITVDEGSIGPAAFAKLMMQLLLSSRYEGLEVEEIRCDPSAIYGGDEDAAEKSDLPWMSTVRNVTGLPIFAAPTNNQQMRIDILREPLRDTVEGGQPRLLISRRMTMTRRGLANGYYYRRINQGGGIKYTVEPEKNKYSHPVEALQYGELSREAYLILKGQYEWQKRARARASAAANAAQGRPRSRTEYDELRFGG